jgi:hypothetical protein
MFLFSTLRNMSSRNNSRGQFIVEALVASTVLLVGFGGMFALLRRSLNLNQTVTQNYVATYLAAEGIEIAKNLADHNLLEIVSGNPSVTSWDQGFSPGDYEADYLSTSLRPNNNDLLSLDEAAGLYSYSGSVPTNFRRIVRISRDSNMIMGEMRVNSIVEVVDPTTLVAKSSVNLEDHFYNWHP